MRQTPAVLAVCLALLACITSSGDEPLLAYAEPAGLVEIGDGRRFNIRCSGEGSPAIVLEAGLGFPSLSWRHVQPALSTRGRACSSGRHRFFREVVTRGTLAAAIDAAIAAHGVSMARRAGLPIAGAVDPICVAWRAKPIS